MNKVIISFIFLIVIQRINAQNVSTIRTLDLMFLPLVYTQNVANGNNSALDSGDVLVDCLLTVKIEKIDSVSKVRFLLGSSNNPDGVKIITGNVINVNGRKSIQYNGINYPFTNYTCSIRIKISKEDFNLTKLVTFYLIDKLNKRSPELFFNINQ